ncbi:MAG: N-acetylneuraminate synthase family protein [Patescibacteria group bacterium]
MLPRSEKFNFENLFIFEMANNHQGDVEHGKRIIREMGGIAKEFGIRAAVKLQFRDLDTFIHPLHVGDKSNKHIPRFLGTRLSKEQFCELIDDIRAHEMIPLSTPFDERSVDWIEEFNLPIIKIGSCSAQDRPLLERVSASGRPVILSTGGLTFHDIDWAVNFLEKRAVHFALMHCVAEYPVSHTSVHLNQIELMCRAYRGVTIGFSTHESPSEMGLIGLAYTKGARIFEKHVGVETDIHKLNAYSANPEQVRSWVQAWKFAVEACGSGGERAISEKEQADLQSLKRGVYITREVKKDSVIDEKDVFFAIPIQKDQLSSDRWLSGLTADRDYHDGDALCASVRSQEPTEREMIFAFTRKVRRLLNEAKLFVGHDIKVELSAHYGIKNFHKYGCVLVECVMGEEYAKKIIVQIGGQWNPSHYHKKKLETFHVLHGELTVEVEGRLYRGLPAGAKLSIPRGVVHAFGTDTGVIFEEISTAEVPGDSFYHDPKIAGMPRQERKVVLQNWGKYQFEELK